MVHATTFLVVLLQTEHGVPGGSGPGLGRGAVAWVVQEVAVQADDVDLAAVIGHTHPQSVGIDIKVLVFHLREGSWGKTGVREEGCRQSA